MLIDTHCHLTDCGDFADTADSAFLKKMLVESEKSGVGAFVTASARAEDFPKILKLIEKEKNVFATIGIHPFYTEENVDLATLADFLKHPKIIGIGEIGLDFSPKHQASAELQIAVLEKQLKIATALQKPIILHCVKASATLFKLLKKFKINNGVLHGFGGSVEEAKMFIKLGFKISFNGNLLKPNFKRVRQLAEMLPIDSILLESDYPYATHPADLPKILSTLAQFRQSPAETLQLQILHNTYATFNYYFPR